MPSKPENPYARLYENFLKQTEHHVLTVEREDGLDRRLLMRDRAQGSIWHWRVVTWPGCLATVGDVADGYVFSREADMLAFFDTCATRDYYSDGTPCIDFRYWAEKLRGEPTAVRYSRDWFLSAVRTHLEEDDEIGLEAQREHEAVIVVARRVTQRHGIAWDDYLDDLRHRDCAQYGGLEIDPDDADEMRFFGLPIPERSPSQRREAILEDARAHADIEHEAREWLDAAFPGSDTWEWDLRDFTPQFLYTCWAIDKTVQAWKAHSYEQRTTSTGTEASQPADQSEEARK